MQNDSGKQRYAVTDYLYWGMMLFVNVPNLLELVGIDTMFKPYRVIALVICAFVWPKFVREAAVTRQFSRLLFAAIFYGSIVTVLFGGRDMLANVPLIGSILILYVATFGVTSRRSLIIGLYASVVSFIVSAYFGLLAFNQGEYRLSGLFENPNAIGFGGCFVLLIVINRNLVIPNGVRLAVAVGLIPIMVLTGSRNALVGMVGCFMSQTWRNPRLFNGLLITGLVIAGVSLYFEKEISRITQRAVFTRLTNRDVIARGGAGRIAVASAALQVGYEHGFVGIGFGQYREKYHTKFFRERRTDGTLRKLGSHNFYVTLLTEWGFFGFCCFALMMYRLAKATEGMGLERDFVIGFLAVSMLNSLGNDMVGMIHFWVMLGVCVQFIRFAHEDELAWQPYQNA
ncbi:O-antigen ligase family protein [Stieleria varia]|uniref:O-Antigen ligase n=1 Tax=Stieleria varia TaxID=2528005 RepID=A0A5C6AGR9_9BACT|nr:O-antigen ligase family protein [Stieleria varia]TWT98627.1 O-Antigen ligase [Stieleria varia]